MLDFVGFALFAWLVFGGFNVVKSGKTPRCIGGFVVGFIGKNSILKYSHPVETGLA
jgi:hypothetical protein